MMNAIGALRQNSKLIARMAGLGMLVGGIFGSPPSLVAMPNCTAAAISALGVSKMTIATATDVAATGPNPEFCDVKGSVETDGNSAGFEVKLPADWNGKFLFYGVGGLAGNLGPAASRADVREATVKGYATAVTDTGHQAGGTDGSWALASPGVPNMPKVIDYYYRAAHVVTVAAKQLVQSFYAGQTIKRAYFDGCSNGGRMALMEAERYPDDYDGIIAGAPFMSAHANLLTAMGDSYEALTPDAYVPPATLAMVDQAVYASCDAADGVKDGLIQNPAKCSFKAESLVCKGGDTANCLSAGQASRIDNYIRGIRDAKGHLLYPGMAVTDLGGRSGAAAWTFGATTPDFKAAEPWSTGAPLGWQFTDHILKNIVELDPNFDTRKFGVSPNGVARDADIKLFDKKTADLAVGDPSKLLPFIKAHRKLLMYHGFSDPALPPFRTIVLYEQLAALTPGRYAKLQDNVRLFMVPGMQHCGGGPGPNSFNTLEALDKWVDQGSAPDQLLATKYTEDNPAQGVARTMPLCEFPAQAEYKGSGDVNDVTNWSCTRNTALLDVGPDGLSAGLVNTKNQGNDDGILSLIMDMNRMELASSKSQSKGAPPSKTGK